MAWRPRFDLVFTKPNLHAFESANALFGKPFPAGCPYTYRDNEHSTTIMTHPEIQPVEFLFLNTAHPSEASTPRSLSRIRSHVAKENRARAARTRPAADEKAQYRVRQRKQTINSSITSSRCQTQGGEDAEKRCETALLPPILPDQSFSAVEPQWNPVRTLSAREIKLLDHCMPLSPNPSILVGLTSIWSIQPDTCSQISIMSS